MAASKKQDGRRSNDPPGRGGEKAETTSILVSAANIRWIACDWRKRQLPQKREKHGPTSLKLVRI
jgi:hypothetical protein